MKKNLLIGILIITTIALGIVAYTQKNNAETQQEIAASLRIEAEQQRQIAEHAMEETERLRSQTKIK